MLRFDQTKLAQEEFYGAIKTTKIWDIGANYIIISKLIETKNNSKYLIGYLDEVIKPLVLILSKVSGYIKNFKDKNNQLMSLPIDDDKLLEKNKTIWTRIAEIKSIKLHTLSVYDNRYIKTKIRTHGDKVCTNFRGLNAPEDGAECKSFAINSIDYLLVYESKY